MNPLMTAFGLSAILVATPLASLTSTDDTATDTAADTVAATSAPEASTAADLEYDYPDDADVMVFSGGRYQVAGDGTVFRTEDFDQLDDYQGWQRTQIVPLPPPPIAVAHIDEAGMQQLFATLDDFGLLDHDVKPPEDYDWCCDRPAIAVTVVTDDAELNHVYPTGDSGEGFSDELLALRDFTDELSSIEGIVGGRNVSNFEPYIPNEWVLSDPLHNPGVRARDWPLDEPATTSGCVELPSEDWKDSGSGLYTDGGREVWASPAHPWTDCDAETDA